MKEKNITLSTHIYQGSIGVIGMFFARSELLRCRERVGGRAGEKAERVGGGVLVAPSGNSVRAKSFSYQEVSPGSPWHKAQL